MLDRLPVAPRSGPGRAVRLAGAVLFSVSLMTWGMASSAWSLAPRQPLLPTSPVSNSVLMAQAIRSGRVTLPARPAAPAVSVLGNVKASGNGASSVNEDPIAADPNNASHLETAGNDYNCGSLQG